LGGCERRDVVDYVLCRIYKVTRQLQIAGNFIGDWHVHIDRFKKVPLGCTVLVVEIGSDAPSPRYSGIAAAEVSEIQRNSDALRRKISDREPGVDFAWSDGSRFRGRFGFKFGLQVINYPGVGDP
jgi:hypothetical protein